MNLNVSSTVVSAKRIGNAIIVQNLGPDAVFLSFDPAVTASTGLKLVAFDAITLPAETSGSIYVISEGSSDVRMLGAGAAAAAPVTPPSGGSGSITQFVGGNFTSATSYGSFSFGDFAQGIELSAAPTADVNYSVAYTSADIADISFFGSNPQTGTISSGSQSIPFSVSGSYSGSNSSFTLTATITLSSADTDFDGVTASYDLVAAVPAIEFNGLDPLVEGGSPETFSWQVNTAPASDVTISFSSTNTDAVFTDGTILAGTTGSTSAGTIQLLDNATDEGEISITVTTSSADPAYDGLLLNVSAYDNPVLVTTPQVGPIQPAPAYSAYITSSGSTTQDHSLGFTPTADVVLVATVSGPEAADYTVSPSTLTFTTGNFTTPQTVTYSYIGSETTGFWSDNTVTWTVDASSTDTSRVGDTDDVNILYDPQA